MSGVYLRSKAMYGILKELADVCYTVEILINIYCLVEELAEV